MKPASNAMPYSPIKIAPPTIAMRRCFNRRQNNCHGDSGWSADKFWLDAVSFIYFNRMRGSLQASSRSAMKLPITSSAVAMTTQSTTR